MPGASRSLSFFLAEPGNKREEAQKKAYGKQTEACILERIVIKHDDRGSKEKHK